MQNMLAQFSGLVVDWKRGLVRPSSGGDWSWVEVKPGFWDDLQWWSDHLELRNCIDISEERALSGVISGTDASDWGTGQLAYVDGARSEARLQFTSAERRRPINWRELLGIIRIVEWMGHELRGYRVTVETNNTSARGAAEKGSSSSADMAELLRRLADAAAERDIELKFTHTPGVLLQRPDGTSRGEAMDEPRARLRAEVFAVASARAGGFTEWLGKERLHLLSPAFPATEEGERRIWAHPTFDTVATVLRQICAQMARDSQLSGMVLVPDHPTAQWAGLLRHFRILGRLEEGSAFCEQDIGGGWAQRAALRPALMCAFPRAAGAAMRRVAVRAGQDSGGRVRVETNPPLGVLPLLPGELVYAPGPTAAKPGVLYMVWDTFDPSADGLPGTGDLVVKVLELVRWPKGKRLGGHTYSLSLMPVSDAYGERPFQSLAPGEVPWEVDAYLLWTAGSWADELPKGTVEKSTKWRPAQRLARSPLGQAWLRAFSFDPRAADIELARTGRKLIEDEGRQPAEPREASQVVMESDSRRQVHTSDMEPAKPARTAATRSAVAFGKATLEAPRADPDRPRAGQAPEAGLAPRKEPHQSTRRAPEGSADVENIGELLGEMAIKGDDDLRPHQADCESSTARR